MQKNADNVLKYKFQFSRCAVLELFCHYIFLLINPNFFLKKEKNFRNQRLLNECEDL